MTQKIAMTFSAAVFLLCATAEAGSKERVAVAEAIVWAAQNARPGLPADNFQAKLPNQSGTNRTLKISQQEDYSISHDSSSKTQKTHQNTPAVDDRNGTLPPPRAVSQVRHFSGGSLSQSQTEPIQIKFSGAIDKPVSEPAMRAQLLILKTSGCQPCQRLEKDIKEQLTPLGWSIGNDQSVNQIVFRDDTIEDGGIYPIIWLYQNGKSTEHWHGYQSVSMLSTKLRQAWDSASEGTQTTSIQAHGSAGTIKAKLQIRGVLVAFRQYIGEGIPVTGIWDRSGTQSLPLLARGDWSWFKILGATGHFQIEAKGAVSLPLVQVGFGYRIRGDDVEVDADPAVFDGILRKYRLNKSTAMASVSEPAGVFIVDDIITIGSFLSSIKLIAEMLWPSVDLTLPVQISGNAILNGDTLIVDFQQPATVKAQMLFTFNLAVKRLEINERNIHVEFSGSRVIKSRDFEVQ